jgi:hypothetical protein
MTSAITPKDSDQAWLDALAAEGQSDSPPAADTLRDARALRSVLQAQAAEDAAAPLDTNLERRMLALLEADTAARFADRGARGGADGGRGGLWARWMSWWNSPSAFSRPLAGGAFAAIVAGVLVVMSVTQEPDDASQMKSAPGSAPAQGASAPASLTLWTVPGDPLASALDLQRALTQAGAQSSLLQGDNWVRLQVDAPASAVPAVAAVLSERGLVLPQAAPGSAARLVLEVRAAASPNRP